MRTVTTGAAHHDRRSQLIAAVLCTLACLAVGVPVTYPMTCAASAVAGLPPGSSSDLISLSLTDADVRSVFTLLADLAGMNLVMDSAVQGTVTITLNQVPLRDAIDLAARAARASVSVTGNLLVVGASGPMTEGRSTVEEMIVRVYSLQYADPTKVAELAAMVVPAIRVSSDESAKRVVARGTVTELEQFEAFLDQFDRAGRQVLIETRVEEVSRETARSLGLLWSMPTFTTQWNAASASLPVSIEKLAATLDALETTGNARLLARPTITAVSGEQATIFVGDRVPIVLKGGPEGNDRIEYIEAGIQLEIVARAGDDGLITTHVKPQVSSIVSWTPQGMPQIRSRNAETTVRVRDGQSIIIGGLIREEDREGMSRLPGLGSLPIIGNLFRQDRVEGEQFETLIILTPHLVSDTNAELRPLEIEAVAEGSGESATLPGERRTGAGHMRFASLLAVRAASPISQLGEVALGWAEKNTRWEMRFVFPLSSSQPTVLRYGLGWRIDDRWAWLRLGGDVAVATHKPDDHPKTEVELALGLNLIRGPGFFMEPLLALTWPASDTGFGQPSSTLGVTIGVRL